MTGVEAVAVAVVVVVEIVDFMVDAEIIVVGDLLVGLLVVLHVGE